MVAEMAKTIWFRSSMLGYGDACRIARRVSRRRSWRLVVLHLPGTFETSTAALARLVVLRRELLRRGRDLRIVGLVGRARALYEISRLENVLPQAAEA